MGAAKLSVVGTPDRGSPATLDSGAGSGDRLGAVELDLDILSPEKTVLSYRLAGIGARVGAHIVDVVAVVFGWILAGTVAGYFGIVLQISLLGLVYTLLLIAWPILYFCLLEGFWNGQTLGKKVAGLRVRLADGTPVTPLAAAARNLLRPADMLPIPYFSGIVAMFLNPRLQRLGDLVAGTVVVHEPKRLPPVNIAPHRVGVHPLEHLVGDLRKLTENEYYALRRYCDRFPELSTEVQNRLTDRLWLPIAHRLGIGLPRDVHPVYIAEATVMKFGREKGLL